MKKKKKEITNLFLLATAIILVILAVVLGYILTYHFFS